MSADKPRPFFAMTEEEFLAEMGGKEPESPPDRPTPEETKFAAEIAVFLEDDVGVDLRRILIRVKECVVYLQGAVDTAEQLADIQELLPHRPQVRGVELQLRVRRVL